ncbi:MAG TPA: YqhA family protein [Afipia sp.]
MHPVIARIIVLSRWALVPFFIGLLLALLLLMVSFFKELWHFTATLFSASETQIVMAVLSLIDLTLIASLMVVVIFSGYENFVEKIDRSGSDSWPIWMTKITLSGLKQKLFASMMAISGITLLKALMKLEISVSESQVKWLVVANVIFVVSYAVLTLTERFARSDNAE